MWSVEFACSAHDCVGFLSRKTAAGWFNLTRTLVLEGFKEGRGGSGATTVLWEYALHSLCTGFSFSRIKSQ